MTTKERTEIDRHEAAGEAANAQRTTDTHADIDQQIIDRVTVFDFKFEQKADAILAEHTQHKALLEDIQSQLRVIAEGYAANAQSIEDMKAALEQQIKQVDHRIMVFDVRLHAKLDGLESRFDAKLDGLESRFDAKLDRLGAKFDAKLDAFGKGLSRLAAHLGLEGAPYPAKRL